MNDISTARMSSMSFDPQDFVKELTSKASVSIDALVMARKCVQNLADETNSQLKKNVYKNYSLFIDTAKEISYLKSEMSQLNHLLTDQQNLMSSLMDVSIGGHRPGLTASEKKEALDKVKENKEKAVTSNTVSKELSALLDKIEGSAGILETRTRSSVLFSGELMELDINDYKAIQPIFAILLNDGLIVSSILPPNSSRSQRKYKFQTIYDLDNIAVVNVKDPNFETAFKILMVPTTKVFRADSKQTKNQWLESFEAAKKQRKASLTLQRRDSLMYISTISVDGSQTTTGGKTPMSPIDRPYSSIMNPFEEVADLLEEAAETDEELVPQWLTELPEDLDVCIAQRNFEDAVELVLKVNDHFAVYPKCCDNIMQTDLKLRIEHRIKELIDALTSDLQIAPDRSLQTGPRSSRRAVGLLLKLGKSSLATKLFLNQRSALLKFCLKQQKIEGATLQYIKRMSSVFFNNVIETTKEFQKAFDLSVQSNGSLVTPPSSLLNDNLNINGDKLSPTQNQSSALPMACLVSWARNQLNHFIGLFSRHVFTTQVSPSVAAECVAIIRYQSTKMKTSIGIDLSFYLDKNLKTDVERIINEIKDKLLEAIKLRAAEDKWISQNFQNKIKISKFLDDMKENGISSLDKYILDECRVELTSNSSTFAKSYLNAMKDLLKLSTPLTKKLVIESLVLTFKAQMKHIATSLKSPQFKAEHKFIEKNATFLLEVVLIISQQYYCERIGIKNCEELSRMQTDYAYLKGSVEPKPRSRSKTSSPTKTSYSSTTYL